MTLREEILSNINEEYHKPLIHINQLKGIYNAYMENKDNDMGKGINWTMEEIFGSNWKQPIEDIPHKNMEK